MAMTSVRDDPATVERRALAAAACLFHGFSEPSRLVILQHLALGPHRVVDLTEHLGLAQSTVSKHLACLRDCGLVTSRAEGRASVFTLSHPAEVAHLLGAAERLLAVTGDAVTLCRTFGTDGAPHGADGDASAHHPSADHPSAHHPSADHPSADHAVAGGAAAGGAAAARRIRDRSAS